MFLFSYAYYFQQEYLKPLISSRLLNQLQVCPAPAQLPASAAAQGARSLHALSGVIGFKMIGKVISAEAEARIARRSYPRGRQEGSACRRFQ
jgi:hypothetical protein